MPGEVEILIDIDETVDERYKIDTDSLEKAVAHISESFETGPLEVSLTVVDDEHISQIHQQFMADPTTTDVISFDLSDDIDEVKMFDMIVNADMADRQAKQRDHSFNAELVLYVVHGMLHCLGYDDLTEADYAVMHAKEDQIMSELGYGVIFARDKKDTGR